MVFLIWKEDSSQNIFMYTQINAVTIQTGLHKLYLRNTMGANLLNVIFLGYGKCE
jgi:hypothetical protein